LRRIERAQVFNKIRLDEYPAFSRLCAREKTQAGAAADLLRVHPKKGRGVMQSERLHDREQA
jgi:hypothetical protein